MQPEESMSESVTGATSSSPVSATEAARLDPAVQWYPRLTDPLPPKWHEVHRESPIRSFEENPIHPWLEPIKDRQALDTAIDRVAAAHCEEHVMKTSILGGEPLTVSRCMACSTVDWADLRAQADAYARRYAARLLEETYGYFEYPDGSRRINWEAGRPRMVNIQQVYNLFTKEPGQDGCAPIPETHTEDTLFKVRRALLGSGLSEQTVTVAINEMQNEGILFRERGR